MSHRVWFPAWKMKNTRLSRCTFFFFTFSPLISIIAAFTISQELFSLINLSVAVLLTTLTGAAAANARRFKKCHVPLSCQVHR